MSILSLDTSLIFAKTPASAPLAGSLCPELDLSELYSRPKASEANRYDAGGAVDW